MAAKTSTEALLTLIQECIKEELSNLSEGTIGGVVIEPLIAALKNNDIERARKIFRMSLSQFSADEIEAEVQNRLKAEKDKQRQYALQALAKQYGMKKGAGVPSPSKVMSRFDMDKRLAGANQPTLPATRITSVLSEEDKIKEIATKVLQELAPGLKTGSSAGLEARVKAMKDLAAKRAAARKQAAPVTAQAPAQQKGQEVVASQPAARKPVPPPIPAAAQKQKKPATPPPTPTPNYAGQVKKVAMNEDIMRNLIKAIIMSEAGK